MSNHSSALASKVTEDRDWTWQEHAACRGEDIDLFFSPEGEREPERGHRERQAKKVCAVCPAIHECRDYAMNRPERSGLWGGMSEDERAAERRRRSRRK